MTDKEKIELILKEKQLNNTQFCSLVGIAPGTLSHILSGRTNPTLNILRSIKFVFKDINPEWLFWDSGPMFLADVVSDDETDGVEGDDVVPVDEFPPTLHEPAQPDLFSQPQSAGSRVSGERTYASGRSASRPGSANPVEPMASQGNAALSASDVSDIVSETLKQMRPAQRKIVEVRIFFDDGTFETFGSK